MEVGVPGGEPTRLAIIAIVSQAELWPDQDDLTIQTEDAAVVAHPSMKHRHANVAEDAVSGVVDEQVRKALPAVSERVHLEKVVLAPVAAQFQLGADAILCAGPLRCHDRLADSRNIALKVESPLVKVACRNRDEG